MRQDFAFPVLKVGAIVQCMHELGINVTEDEVLNPDKHADQCRHMFEQLAEVCTGITKEEIAQPAFLGLNALNYPELHEESVPRLNSYRACCKMMEICGIQDFTVKDFITPTAKRVRRQLSGIINFAKFRGEKYNLLVELSGTREELLNTLNSLRMKNESLNGRLNLLREQTSEEAKVIAAIEDNCAQIEQQISDLNQTQATIREESADLKSTNNELKDAISAASLQFEELTATKKKLAGQIVNSPERFRKQIIDVGQSLQAEQKDAKGAERKLRELQLWLNNVEEAQIEVNSALEAVHELKGEVDRQRAMTADLDSQRQAVSAQRTALGELDINVQQLNRQTSRAEEKLQHLRRQAATRGAETQQAVDDLHRQLLEAENARAQIKSRVERAESEAQRIEREAEAEQQAQEQERADMVACYQRLEKGVITHLQDLRRAIEEEPPVNVA